MNTVTQCNPNPALESILRQSSAAPAVKVRAALMLRGETMRDQAKRLGRARPHYSDVLNGKRESRRLFEDVAADLGVSVDVLVNRAA